MLETDPWFKLTELARSDLDAAQLLVTPGQYHNACFHAQQAAEKGRKALLRSREIPYPKSHDIGGLVDLVRTVLPAFPEFGIEAETLTQFGVEARYREGRTGDFEQGNALEAIGFASAILGECIKLLDIS